MRLHDWSGFAALAGGRLVIGEVFFDPDFVGFGSLVERTGAASFTLETRVGGSLSYLARFRPN